MRIKAPARGIDFHTHDVFGNSVRLSEFLGRRVALSFFRDAACPFCNYRLYELTRQHDEWKQSGMEIVVFFSDTQARVQKYIASRPRPFTMICDPQLEFYQQYRVERSYAALLKASIFGVPEFLRGIWTGGRPSIHKHMNVVPADFLIDSRGNIVEAYYGSDTADHIPMATLESFATKGQTLKMLQLRQQLEHLKAENERLKKQ